MKYAAVVFRNITTATDSVDFQTVADALLSGGIPLKEIVLLPYDDPHAVMLTLDRLGKEYEGVFVICDRVLVRVAGEAVSAITGSEMQGALSQGKTCLFGVLPAGKKGAEIVKSEMIPAIDRLRGQSYYSIVIRTIYAQSSKVMAAIARAQEEAGGQIEIHASEEYGVGRIEFIYDRNTPKVVADEAVRIVASDLKDFVYAMEDVSISERLFEALKLHRLKLSTAESFTGGGVGQALVSNPGASAVFYEGLNTYDSLSKQKRLGVSEYTLRNKGAVSSETACEMAAGLLKEGVDVAIATTGIAGPASDGTGIPPGQCYIAIGTKDTVRVYDFRLEGDRETITKTAINLALFLAYKEIH